MEHTQEPRQCRNFSFFDVLFVANFGAENPWHFRIILSFSFKSVRNQIIENLQGDA